MRTPPLLLAATLLFWGYQCDYLILSSFLSVMIELSSLSSKRWDFSLNHLTKVTDTCTVSIAAAVIYFLSSDPQTVLNSTLKLMPLLLFPIILAQELSLKRNTDIRALFLYARKKRGEGLHKNINLTYPYLYICIVATGAANTRSDTYFLFILTVLIIGLFSQKPGRYSFVSWLCILILTGFLGYTTHKGLLSLQGKLTDITLEMFMGDYENPERRSTSLGDIGKLKTSNSILFRVIPQKNRQIPYLLKEASYNFYKDGEWFAARSVFTQTGKKNMQTVRIRKGDVNHQKITVITPLKKGKGLLKIPENGVEIKSQTLPTIRSNRMGSYVVSEGPGLFSYDVVLSDLGINSAQPDQLDLDIPDILDEELGHIIRSLNLEEMDETDILIAIRNYFLNHFSYSLELNETSGASPVKGFLTETRQGHCEFFAVSTVLLLRKAGIPARYVSGYSAHERSFLEGKILVRQKHSHAWVEAWIRGNWVFFDTTPPSWRNLEKSSMIKRIIPDLFSMLGYGLSYLRWNQDALKKHALWLLIPLLIIIIRRFLKDKNKEKLKSHTLKKETIKVIDDKPVYTISLLEDYLGSLGYNRLIHETYPVYINRIKNQLQSDLHHTEPVFNSILTLMEVHTKNRFSQLGISSQESAKLKKDTDKIIKELSVILKT